MIIKFNLIYFILTLLLLSIFCFAIIYYLYNIMLMVTKPIYAIAVFNDTIKGTARYTEEIVNNRIKKE